MCKRIMKSETQADGDIPFYKIGTFGGKPNAYISRELFEMYKKHYAYPKKGDVLISAAGTIGRTVVFDGQPAYFQDSNIVWIDNDETKVLNEFLYYWYQTTPWDVSNGGTISRLYNDNIAKAKVPVVSIEIQRETIKKLKEVETFFASINEDISKEIVARKTQYIFYRDSLMNLQKIEK